jgi:hypothetical protein
MLEHCAMSAERQINYILDSTEPELRQTWVTLCKPFGVQRKQIREDDRRAMPGISALDPTADS